MADWETNTHNFCLSRICCAAAKDPPENMTGQGEFERNQLPLCISA
jgi:hypothetical protein